MKLGLKHRVKELFFDYHSSIDYNPFGGGFKPNGSYTINKQKLINIILLLSFIFLLSLII